MIDMKPIRVLLAEDHTLVRAGIRVLLQECGWIKVIAETGEGNEALRLVKKERPDLVLMDIAMPGLNGIEATARIKKEYPETKVIILSMYANEEYVLQALRDGASGYLLKDAGPVELELAIKSVIRGDTYLSPPVSRQVIADYIARFEKKAGKSEANRGAFGILTSRQREILQLIAEGLTTKDISQKLNLSINTVETHRSQLMERLGIHDVAGLVRYAIREGIVKI
jgi:DNA-binding NarL/FixJ family response regulator